MSEFVAPAGTALLWKVTLAGGLTYFVGSPSLKAIVNWYESEGGDIREVKLLDAVTPVTVLNVTEPEED